MIPQSNIYISCEFIEHGNAPACILYCSFSLEPSSDSFFYPIHLLLLQCPFFLSSVATDVDSSKILYIIIEYMNVSCMHDKFNVHV